MSDSQKTVKSVKKRKPQRGEPVPTKSDRQMVLRMAAMGATKKSISTRLKIHVNTLKVHYAEELGAELDLVISTAADNIVAQVMKGNLDSSEFVLTHKGGWSKTHKIQTNVEIPPIGFAEVGQDGIIPDTE